MSSARQIHLPTEIVFQVMIFVAADEFARQTTLHACCLVSRQWYSAAIALLYEKPHLNSGASFRSFTATISPPIGVRKSKWNLGAFLRKLDLSSLVHHSSPSLTARLLGRVKENLEVLIAPRVSFSLPALSKCLKLRHLDLSLVGDAMPFPLLKRAVSRLDNLTALRLPQSTSISDSESFSIPWPPSLRRLQFSGRFSPLVMPTFPWPPSLTTLTLKNCADLSETTLSTLISSPDLARTLKRLTVSGFNRHLSSESINAILVFLPNLSFLSIPGDLVESTFLDLLYHVGSGALEVLEFGYPSFDAALYFTHAELLRLLRRHGAVPNLRAVGFSEVFCTEDRMVDDDEIDEILTRRAQSGPSVQTSPDAHRSVSDVDPGVYYV
ncbi:hypothetical protein AOCH_007069 [Aspergillus ochraceoroseus]|uniref:Uncharacterized protein n=2 Tax=Aspergillus ochraceoroseus TaxID=138278 RepID=A0A0F8UFZ2_9EURO|nr:hypothetical protein AOCH_007069 [Aspergillus ochraceoroseus]